MLACSSMPHGSPLRVPKSIVMEPRSSRLKDKRKGEGEMLIKELFFQDMMQNNKTLHILGKGSSVVLPQNSLNLSLSSESQGGFQSATKSRLFPSLCSPNIELKTTSCNARDDDTVDRMQVAKRARHCDVKDATLFLCGSNGVPSTGHVDSSVKKTSQREQGLFTCVTCGILCFACVAIIQPTEAAAHYLSSADCSIFNDWGVAGDERNFISDPKAPNMTPCSGTVHEQTRDGLFDVPICSPNQVQAMDDESLEMASNRDARKGPSSLGLLALTYGNSSDSEDGVEEDFPVEAGGTNESKYLENGQARHNIDSTFNRRSEVSLQNSDPLTNFGLARAICKYRDYRSSPGSNEFRNDNCTVDLNSFSDRFRHQRELDTLNSKPVSYKSEATMGTGFVPLESPFLSVHPKSDEDSSRLHVFCLHHAVQVEKQLSSIGGARVFLVCHPDYPRLEFQAKKVAEELNSDCLWNEILFREATEEDDEKIQLALDSENAIHGNGDWAVKMGINLFYSANLSRSPLYCKQMPYNFVLYGAFGQSSPTHISSAKAELEGKGLGRHKKIVVAGKWCGKVWMSSQAHPLLVSKNLEEEVHEKGIIAWVKRPDLRTEIKSESNQSAEIAFKTCRSGRKRKSTVENRSLVSPKPLEAEKLDELIQGLARHKCRKQIKSKHVTERLKKETSEAKISDEYAEEFPLSNSWKQIKCKRRTKRVEKEASEVENFDESCEELPISNSWKQIKSKCRTKRQKKETLESESLDESSGEIPLSNSFRQTKNKQGARLMKETPEHKKKHEKSKKQSNLPIEDEVDGGPSTRLRKRAAKPCKDLEPRSGKPKQVVKKPHKDTNAKKRPATKASTPTSVKAAKVREEEAEYLCDMEGCTMSFGSKHELTMHKRNICPVKGCGKKFFSHKYLVQHRRVHIDDRPLKCPWKGCKMSFKWAWARTEHIRVHTGARPYVCTETGCGQTFRFVSDFSRHKRKTGHTPKKARG